VTVQIDESLWEHGQDQGTTTCRDGLWAVLFLLQLTAVVVLAVRGIYNLCRDGVPSSMDDDDDQDNDDNGGGHHRRRPNDEVVVNVTGVVFFTTMVVTVLAVSSAVVRLLLGTLSQMMIQVSLVVSPVCFGFTFVLAMIAFNVPLAFMSLLMSAVGTFYAWGVWHRIPFATANISLAMTAVRDNHGLWWLAYLSTLQASLWTFLWTAAVVQVVVYSPSWVYHCTPTTSASAAITTTTDGDVCTWSTRGRWIVVALLLSLLWTAQVLKNLFHTTIAGVVGTWWFDPTDTNNLHDDNYDNYDNTTTARRDGRRRRCGTCISSCCGCTPAIYDSWVRSCIYSFGSICLGSLLTGLMQVLQIVVRCGRAQQQQRQNEDGLRGPTGGDLFCCLIQFVVDNLEYLLRYFNQWAFVYVGLYGYDYWTAGKQVSGLFRARGWSNIINDQLIGRALGMMSILVGFLTGILGTLIGFVFFGPLAALPTFLVGMVLGCMSCNILFGVVVSAVNTIVVCFAESPNQLRRNHPPALYEQLVQAWQLAYPDECGF
jgi:hypothetical protein